MPTPVDIEWSEKVLRTAIIDVLCAQPEDAIAGRLRRALNESRHRSEHPEDRCEECRRPFETWTAGTGMWERVTGRDHGGPILCQVCFRRRSRQLENIDRAPGQGEW